MLECVTVTVCHCVCECVYCRCDGQAAAEASVRQARSGYAESLARSLRAFVSIRTSEEWQRLVALRSRKIVRAHQDLGSTLTGLTRREGVRDSDGMQWCATYPCCCVTDRQFDALSPESPPWVCVGCVGCDKGAFLVVVSILGM